MMQLLPRNLNIDFIGKWKIATVFSLLMISISFWTWFSLGESKYDTDFTGGYDILVRIGGDSDSEMLRSALAEQGLDGATVVAYERASNEYSVRIGSGDETKALAIREGVKRAVEKISNSEGQVLKSDFVGPSVGEELRNKALWATALGIIGLLIYITIRFEFGFALGAVVAVFHDVIIAGGAYLLAGHMINMSSVAAALTILGYSVNDTIVIFDRVREELRNPKNKDMDLVSLINYCINQTLSRTIITSLLTLLSVIALLVFGGGAIKDLAFFMVVGLISGTYSTVYIAAPVVIAWEWYKRRKSGVVVSSAAA